MDWEKATTIASAIGGSRLADLRIRLLRSAVSYAGIRAQWQLSSPEERFAMNEDRTRAHDAFIEACDEMGKGMYNENEDASWRGKLGDDRKEIGDFACYLNLILGLAAR
ncbi:MAG: hypothetical protein A4E69_01778 [Syntrophus sp. PtaB.Bin138]|nr:MAG: hypothetical protein A4E69_01778 [Syntrophus sp. PtaB.Bin138]